MSGLAVLVWPSVLVVGAILIWLGVTQPPSARAGLAGRRVGEWLVQAGIAGVTPAQLATLCGGLGLLVGLVLAGGTRSVWIGLAFGTLGAYLPVMIVKARRRRRVRELQEVWPDAIDQLVSGVRAGLSLPQAVASLADRGPQPLRPAFARFADAYQATGRFTDGLDQLKDDLADPTADRVVETLRLAREVGGTHVGRTLRTLSAFLRDQYRVRKELEARQSWVLVAARLAFATPWLVLLLLATRPEAMAAYRKTAGGLVLAVGAAMAIAGYRAMLAIGRIPTEQRILR